MVITCRDLNYVSLPLDPPTISTWGNHSTVNSPRLFVSDNPETIKQEYFDEHGSLFTMWLEEVPKTTSVRYRVFMWNSNNSTSYDRKVGLTLGNGGSSSITVSNIKYTTYSGSSGNFMYTVGTCIAKDMLTQSFQTKSNMTVRSNSVSTILEFDLDRSTVRGVFAEFTLSSSSSMIAKLRTVAAERKTLALNQWQGEPISTKDPHPRGSWSYSEVQGSPYTISFGATAQLQGISVMQNNPSIFPSGSNAPVSNPGGFGGIYNINLTIRNTSTKQQTAHLYLNPRGGSFGGAVKVGSNPVYSLNFTPPGYGVKIGGFSINAGQSQVVPIKLTTGGGSSTPVALLVHNLG